MSTLSLQDEDQQTSRSMVPASAQEQVRQPFLAGWMAGFRFCLLLMRRTLDYQTFKPERRRADMQRDLRAFLILKGTMEEELPEPDAEQLEIEP